MSISDTKNNRPRWQSRRILTFLALAVAAVLVNRLYAQFSHGVRSPAMTWMFLYPLLGGALIYLLIDLMIPKIRDLAGYRLFSNVYHSGLAALTAGSFLKGILEIAGTDSPYLLWFYAAGWLLVAAGMAISAGLVIRCQAK